jgi:hypothetical protein
MTASHSIRRRRIMVQCAALAALGVAASASMVRAGTSNQVGDVFYIELENHNFTQPNGNVDNSSTMIEQLKGNPAAPYLNSLITPGNPNAAQSSYASAYHNVLATPSGNNPSIHPSEPNYIWQEAGNNFGINNDADPYTNTTQNNVFSTPNLSALISAKGMSWRSYAEDAQLAAASGTTNNPGTNGLTSTVLPSKPVPARRHSEHHRRATAGAGLGRAGRDRGAAGLDAAPPPQAGIRLIFGSERQ